MTDNFDDTSLDKAALEYHKNPTPGKIAIVATKALSNQRDLSLAYSPGVAAACREITKDESNVYQVTNKGNLVGVITNGTAVLGLGNIGALASKPVMEGKAVLFKRFASIDVYDIEVSEQDPEKFINAVAALEPTFGGINLEDIKAPECFIIEDTLCERMNIPVFHDDQHGTAIVVSAAIHNSLLLAKKKLPEIKITVSGAGAAATACLNLLVLMGAKKENIWIADIDGVLHTGRADQLHERQSRYCQETDFRTLDDIITGADVFLGCSAPNVLTPEMLKKMASSPIILALANPVPEIMPNVAKEVRPDCIIATGRSDFPNQVNNVLCFPFLFRGALDVQATKINDEIKIAAVMAIANLVHNSDTPDQVRQAYAGQSLTFSPNYIIPTPFDPRLISEISVAVVKAAMESGVARRKIDNLDEYKASLQQFVYRSGLVMKPIFDHGKRAKELVQVIFAEGEDERVLRSAQIAIDEKLCKVILIGRREVIEQRIERYGIRYRLDDESIKLIDPNFDPRFKKYWTKYFEIMNRKGVNINDAQRYVRNQNTIIGALAVILEDADAMICGTQGRFNKRVSYIQNIIGLEEGMTQPSTLQMVIMQDHVIFITDTNVAFNPSVQHIADSTILSAEAVRRFGIEPRVAMLSHSNFGRHDSETALKMREALQIIRKRDPDLIIDGEMHADNALDQNIRNQFNPLSTLTGSANLLIMPNIDSASISINLLKSLGNGLLVGPILLGVKKPAYVANNSITVRGLVNMTALAVADVLGRRENKKKYDDNQHVTPTSS